MEKNSQTFTITKKKNGEPVTHLFFGGPGKSKSFVHYSEKELKEAVEKSKSK